MTDAFCGSWIPDDSSVTRVVEYLTTVSAPPTELELIQNTRLIEFFVDEQIFKTVTHITGREPITEVLTLGEDQSRKGFGGTTVLSNTRFENGRLITVLSVLGVEMRFERYIQDGDMKCDVTSRGKTMTFTMKRA